MFSGLGRRRRRQNVKVLHFFAVTQRRSPAWSVMFWHFRRRLKLRQFDSAGEGLTPRDRRQGANCTDRTVQTHVMVRGSKRGLSARTMSHATGGKRRCRAASRGLVRAISYDSRVLIGTLRSRRSRRSRVGLGPGDRGPHGASHQHALRQGAAGHAGHVAVATGPGSLRPPGVAGRTARGPLPRIQAGKKPGPLLAAYRLHGQLPGLQHAQGGQVGCVLRHGPLGVRHAGVPLPSHAGVCAGPLHRPGTAGGVCVHRADRRFPAETNLLAYGNGLVEWMKAHGIVTLPADLKRVMTCVREHVWHHMPEGWKKELKATRRRPILAACLWNAPRRDVRFSFFCARTATLLFFSRGSKGQRRERQKLTVLRP